MCFIDFSIEIYPVVSGAAYSFCGCPLCTSNMERSTASVAALQGGAFCKHSWTFFVLIKSEKLFRLVSMAHTGCTSCEQQYGSVDKFYALARPADAERSDSAVLVKPSRYAIDSETGLRDIPGSLECTRCEVDG